MNTFSNFEKKIVQILWSPKRMASEWDAKCAISNKLVYGYANQIKSLSNIIPKDIIHLCLLYFFEYAWDEKKSGSNALIDNVFVSNKFTNKWFTAFGTIGVNKGIHQWILEIIHFQTTNNIFVGICTSTKYKETHFMNRPNNENENYFSYAFGRDLVSGCGILCTPQIRQRTPVLAWNSGTVIQMTLNLNDATLKYVITRGGTYTIDNIFNNFKNKSNIKYRLAVCSYCKSGSTKLEFVSYAML